MVGRVRVPALAVIAGSESQTAAAPDLSGAAQGDTSQLTCINTSQLACVEGRFLSDCERPSPQAFRHILQYQLNQPSSV